MPDIVKDFEQNYEAALVPAHQAAETTATDGWQALYVQFMDDNRKTRNYCAEQLGSIAESLRNTPLTTDGVKALKESVKDAVAACEAHDTFDHQTVKPLRQCILRLHEVIAEYENRAESMSRSTPLTDGDISDRMAEAIAAVPKGQWNPKVGVATVSLSPKQVQ